MVTYIHGGVNRQQEKADPIHIATPQQVRISTHDQGERLTMTELVIAPSFKPAKDGVKTLVRVLFELPVNGDVSGVANFLGQISRVKNILGFEIGVSLGAL